MRYVVLRTLCTVTRLPLNSAVGSTAWFGAQLRLFVGPRQPRFPQSSERSDDHRRRAAKVRTPARREPRTSCQMWMPNHRAKCSTRGDLNKDVKGRKGARQIDKAAVGPQG